MGEVYVYNLSGICIGDNMAFYYNEEFKDTIAGSGLSLSKTFKQNLRDGKGMTNVISGEDKINESIYTILSTRVGERFFLPEFGSRLHLVVFEQNRFVAHDLVSIYVKEALGNWEKRIVVEDVSIGNNWEDSNIVPVHITYRIANSNIIGSYVYPFNRTIDGVDMYEFGGAVSTTSY